MRPGRVVFILVLLWIACGERPRVDVDGNPPDSVAAGASAVAASTGEPADSAEEPAAPPSPPEGRALRSYPLRLVNAGEGGAVVYGHAGAREVMLDTVASGDSVLLEVRLRTDSLVLRMADLEGATVDSGVVRFPVPLPPDSVSRWPAP